MRHWSENEFFAFQIFISMSISALESWPKLLIRKRADCGAHLRGHNFSTRAAFMGALETAAENREEQNTQNHLIRLHKASKNIEGFASAIENQFEQMQSIHLLPLVWDVSFAVIEVGSLRA